MPPEPNQQPMPPTFAPPMDVQSSPDGVLGQEQAGMATDVQKQQLLDLINKIKGKMGQFHAASSVTSGQQDAQRKDLLKQLFLALQAAGVDVTDPDSVAKFIDELRAESPDLAQLFETAIDSLLGQPPPDTNQDQTPQVMPPQGMM